MHKYLLSALLVCSAALAQPPSASSFSSASADAISVLREGLIDAFVKTDIDRLLTFLDPDVVVTWQNGEICRGPEEVRAYYNRMMTGPNRVVREVKATPEVLGRHVYGDWVVSWGNLRDHFVLTDGSDLPFNSVFTATIARRGDRWLVRGFHVSVNAFNNPVLGAAVKKTGLLAGGLSLLIGLVVGFVLARVKSRKPAA